MTSTPIRDQIGDPLITPENSVLAVIDYQPSQIEAVGSIDHDLLLRNIITTVKVAKVFDLPIVHSTINVANGQGPTLPGLAEELADYPPIDRTAINSWEDVEFLEAIRATGRRKLILCALWTEVCMTFPALDALREGWEVYPVVDAIGGTSLAAHEAGVERTVQAGGQPIGWVSLACELQRDWARTDTVPRIVEIVINERLAKGRIAMTDEEFIRTAYDIAEEKDIQGWIDCFTPDGVFVDHSVEATYVGPAEVAKPVEWYGAAFSNMHRELFDVYVSGEVVVVELALQGTHDGALHLPSGMLPATGKDMDAPCCDVFKLEGGKIKRFHCYPEASVILTQLGVIENFGAALEPLPA